MKNRDFEISGSCGTPFGSFSDFADFGPLLESIFEKKKTEKCVDLKDLVH